MTKQTTITIQFAPHTILYAGLSATEARRAAIARPPGTKLIRQHRRVTGGKKKDKLFHYMVIAI